MCEFLNVIEARGKAEGRMEGRLRLSFELVMDGVLSLADAARRVNLAENEFAKKFDEYKANVQTR